MRSGSPSILRRRLAVLAACVCIAGTWGCTSFLSALPRGLSSVHGEVHITGKRESVARLGPGVVVYLEHRDGHGWRSFRTRTLSDATGASGQELVVLGRGQALRFASESGVAHRPFAVRGTERIDLEVREGGRSRRVRMDQPGWIRFYCALHEDETWDVYVAPSAHFARLERDGQYRIGSVPPGDYVLGIWSEAVSGAVRPVHVGAWTSAVEPIWLDPAKLAP